MSKIKYKKLCDHKWLSKQYISKQLSCLEIAEIIGCSKDAVRLALKKLSIPLRSSKETNAIAFRRKGRQSRVYWQLNDREWLAEKYLIEKLSTKKIAKLIGAKTPNTVRQALIGFDIPVRSISDGLTINNEDGFIFNESVITGCLLGDGGYHCYNRNSDYSYPYFYKKNKFYDHTLFVAESLFVKDPSLRISEAIHKKGFLYYKLTSFANKALKKEDRKWYPEWNGFKKVIPIDIKIDETVLLHWYLDDGTSSYRKDRKKKQVVLTYCTECFSKQDQQMLCDKINCKFPVLDTRLIKCKTGTGWRIRIPQSKTDAFFNLIGKPPVNSLEYKWK